MLQDLRNRLSVWNRERRLARRDDRTKPHQLAVMGIMKNEARNLDEWISHYLWQGAGKIVLIDNGSTDTTMEVLAPWIEKGVVSVISLTRRHRQRQHYWTAFRKFHLRREARWLLVADIDEFWYCPDGRIVARALDDYDPFDVIYVNWALFGSSGQIEHPKSLRRALTWRAPNLCVPIATKYVCRTDILRRGSIDIHKIKGACSSRTISDNTAFRMNHYMTQSRAFFAEVKMTRGSALSSKSDAVRQWDYFDRIEGWSTVEDHDLAGQVARLEHEGSI